VPIPPLVEQKRIVAGLERRLSVAFNSGVRFAEVRFAAGAGTSAGAILVQKLWNYCNILRDDGLPYGDHVEQLSFLLFLKMADEQAKVPFNKTSPILMGCGWHASASRFS